MIMRSEDIGMDLARNAYEEALKAATVLGARSLRRLPGENSFTAIDSLKSSVIDTLISRLEDIRKEELGVSSHLPFKAYRIGTITSSGWL